MVAITTSTAEDRVDMSDPDLVRFQSGWEGDATHFGWFSALPGTVVFYGSGFTYSGTGDASEATGGAVSSISLDIDANAPLGSGDLVFGDTAAVIVANFDKDDPRAFWNEVLKGKDTFDLTGLDEDIVGFGANVIFGDDLASATVVGNAISDQGARDIIRGGDNQFDLIGDVVSVVGDEGAGQFARYDGGRDRIDSGGLAAGVTERQIRMAGDAFSVGTFSVLRGGDDRLAFAGYSGAGQVAGDALQLTWGRVNGGADTIVVELAAGAPFAHVAGDVLSFLGGQAVLNGGADAIRIIGATAFVGGDAYEVLSSTSGVINGGADRMTGSGVADVLAGEVAERGSFSVTIVGGNDYIDGGAGNDLLVGETAAGFSVGFEIAMSGGDDTLLGGRDDDSIFGQTGDDRLFGGDGKDRLSGGSGDDYAEGGDSADVLFGDLGRDTLDGGAGKDRFDYFQTSYSGPANSERDRIVNFIHGEDDIDLSDIDAIEGGGAGNDAFTFIGADPFIQAGQVRVVQMGADTWVEANTIGANGAEMRIVLLGVTATTITADDFIL